MGWFIINNKKNFLYLILTIAVAYLGLNVINNPLYNPQLEKFMQTGIVKEIIHYQNHTEILINDNDDFFLVTFNRQIDNLPLLSEVSINIDGLFIGNQPKKTRGFQIEVLDEPNYQTLNNFEKTNFITDKKLDDHAFFSFKTLILNPDEFAIWQNKNLSINLQPQVNQTIIIVYGKAHKDLSFDNLVTQNNKLYIKLSGNHSIIDNLWGGYIIVVDSDILNDKGVVTLFKNTEKK